MSCCNLEVYEKHNHKSHPNDSCNVFISCASLEWRLADVSGHVLTPGRMHDPSPGGWLYKQVVISYLVLVCLSDKMGVVVGTSLGVSVGISVFKVVFEH